MSMYDRERRIEMLERDVDLINSHLLGGAHDCHKCGQTHVGFPVETVIKLSDQKRKLLESIARERNEWMKPEESPLKKPALTPRERYMAAIAESLGNAKEAKVIEGAIVVDKPKDVLQPTVRLLPKDQTSYARPPDSEIEGGLVNP